MSHRADGGGGLPRIEAGGAARGGPTPERTCVGCRRTRAQTVLIRFVRTSEGLVEPDLSRQRGGRGAYVCAQESCLAEANRRGRWPRAFRGPARLAPGTIERLRVLFTLAPEALRMNDGTTCAGEGPANDVVGGMSEPVEGGW